MVVYAEYNGKRQEHEEPVYHVPWVEDGRYEAVLKRIDKSGQRHRRISVLYLSHAASEIQTILRQCRGDRQHKQVRNRKERRDGRHELNGYFGHYRAVAQQPRQIHPCHANKCTSDDDKDILGPELPPAQVHELCIGQTICLRRRENYIYGAYICH